MSLGKIAALKEASPVIYRPLLLVEITVNFGTPAARTLYVSSNDVVYGGNQYLPRLLKPEDLMTQLSSDSGIDWPPNVSIEIADPDSVVYSAWELPYGLKGAVMVIRFVFWDVGTTNFSDDSMVKFGGRCNSPGVTETAIQVSAISKLNMSQNALPSLHVQKLCPWTYPLTQISRQAAADDTDSPSTECGYSPDCTGGNARGNLAASGTMSGSISPTDTTVTVGSISGTLPATPFVAMINAEAVYVTAIGSPWTIIRAGQSTVATSHSGASVKIPYGSCDKSRGSCMARMGNASDTSLADDGNIEKDESNRATGTFGGIVYVPLTSSVSRGYVSGKWELIINNSNEAKYGDLVPLCYGTTWVDPLVLQVVGDGNYTNIEVLCCYGLVSYVFDVVVNGVRIPHTYNDTKMTSVPNELPGNHDTSGGWWSAVNDGRRFGHQNSAMYRGGDPHGSLCVLVIQVPIKLASADSVPRVSVRLNAGNVRVHSTPTVFTTQFSDNPIWVMRDVLNWAQWTSPEMNIQSLIDTAARVATQINYSTMYGYDSNLIADSVTGVSVPYSRYACSFTLRQRQSAADVIRGLRNYAGITIAPNYDTGLLDFGMRSTLADQQSVPPQLNGTNTSNFNSPIISPAPDGTPSTGYLAYDFDESNIAKKKGSDESTLIISQRPISNSPNSIGSNFLNAENKYNQDSLTVYDTEDIARVNQEVSGSFPLIGPNTFDRTRRPIARYQAEFGRGNPRYAQADGAPIGDSGGTITASWETSVKGITLRNGDIVRLNYQQRGIVNWLLRISSIGLTRNAERIKVTATYHNDLWYLFTYGQTTTPLYTTDYRKLQDRPPYAWSPALIFPAAGDALYGLTDGTFGLTEQLSLAQDGTQIINLQISGSAPVNSPQVLTAPPYINPIATTVSTGGSIPGGIMLYLALSAKDVSGSVYKPSAPSPFAMIAIPAGTNTNRVTLAIPFWPLNTPGWILFAGRTSTRLVYQTDANTTPATITLSSLSEASWAMPDTQYSKLVPTVRQVAHSGVVGAQVLSVTSTTITLACANTVTDHTFDGRVMSLLGIVDANSNPFGALQSGVLPIFNANISQNINNVFTLAAGLDGTIPDPTAVPRGDGSFGIHVGDTMVIRMKPTYVSNSNGNGMQESLWANQFALVGEINITAMVLYNPPPHAPIPAQHQTKVTTSTPHMLTAGQNVYLSGMTGMAGGSPPYYPGAWIVTKVFDAYNFAINVNPIPLTAYVSGGKVYDYSGLFPNSLQGYTARAIAGTGRGTSVTTKSNTLDTIYIVGNFPVAPDATTVWVIEFADSIYSESRALNNDSPLATLSVSPQITNFANEIVGVLVLTENGAGLQCLEANSPYRETLIYGGVGQTAQVKMEVTGTATIPPGVTQVLADATGGSFTLTIPDPPNLIRPMVIARKDAGVNVVTVKHLTSPNTIQGSATVLLDNNNLKSIEVAQATASASKIINFYGTTGSSGVTYSIYDPRAYGGDPLGVVDSTAAVGSAIAAGGLYLEYPCVFATALQSFSPADGFRIWGGGTLLFNGTSTSVLTISSASNIKLEDFQIDGNSTTGVGHAVMNLISITHGSVRSVRLKGGQGVSFAVLTSTKLSFLDCDTMGCATTDMTVDTAASVLVTACRGMIDNGGN